MQDHALTKLEVTPENATLLADQIANLYDKKARDIYVIMSKDETTILKNPGLGRPWSSKVFKMAEHVAKQVGNGAHVVTLEYAIKKLMQTHAKRN